MKIQTYLCFGNLIIVDNHKIFYEIILICVKVDESFKVFGTVEKKVGLYELKIC